MRSNCKKARWFINFLITIVTFYALLQIDIASGQAIKSPDQASLYFEKGTRAYNLSKYDSASYYYRSAANLYDVLGNDVEYLRSLINVANCQRAIGEFSSALNILVTVEEFPEFNLNNHHLLKSELLHVKGSIFSNIGKASEGVELLTESIALREQYSDANDSLLAYSYNNLGNNYFYEGNREKALESYKKALEVALTSKRSIIDPDIALYYQNIGIIHALRGDFKITTEYFLKNLSINKQIYGSDHPSLGVTYLNMGRLKYLLHELDEAKQYLDKADTIFTKHFGPNYYGLGTVYMNMGNVFNSQNDYEKALEYYKKAQRIYNKQLDKRHPNIYKIVNNIGSILLKKKEFSAALENYMKSYSATKDPISKTLIARNLGNIFHELGDSGRAEYYYKQSIIQAVSKLQDNHYETGHSYIAYSKFCLQNGKLDTGLQYAAKAYRIFLENFGFKNPNVSEALSTMGEFYYQEGGYAKALNHFQQALISNAYGFTDTNVYHNPKVDSIILESQLLEPLIGKAKSFRKLSQSRGGDLNALKASLESCKLASRIVDRIRLTLRQESKLYFSGDVDNIYANAIYVGYDLYQLSGDPEYLEQSFLFSEKSRFSVLLSGLRDIEAVEFGGIPDSLKQLEKELKEKISLNEKWIYEEKQSIGQDQDKISNWESNLFMLHTRYDSLINTFEKDYEDYYRLKYDTEIADVKTIRKQLRSDQAILEYFIIDTVLFTYLIDPSGISLIKTPVGEDFNYHLENLRQFYQASILNHTKDVYWGYIESASVLYSYLIKPLQQNLSKKSLIIIPDGQLGYIPFESLISNVPQGKKLDYRNLDYLLNKHPVSYSYSATILFDKLKRKTFNEMVLAMAPVYQGDNIRNQRLSEGDDFILGPIFHSEYEVSEIDNMFDGVVLKEENATEENFKILSDDFSILHLSMHTIIDDDNPMYSKLIFSEYSDTSSTEDGFLHTYELYNLQLKAQLAVLSACNTGKGRLHESEGVINLARGFTYAGVPSIVMTLWEVEDKAGAEIMLNFYDNLRKGLQKDEALRQAKMDYLKQKPQFRAHPYFWSAYVLIGNTDPIVEPKWRTPALLAGFGFVLIVVVFALQNQRRRQKK